MFNKVKYSSLNELIYEEIKAKIINNELKPNEKLDVDFLSNSLGVSRTRSGSYVRELSKEELSCIFNFREALESQVIREVISIADMQVLDGFGDEFRKLLNIEPDGGLDAKKRLVEDFFDIEMRFHEYLIDLCPKIIGDEIKNLIDLTKRIRILHITYNVNSAPLEKFHYEIKIHCQLIEALRQHLLDKCIELIAQDIRNTKNEIMDCFDEIN